MSQEKNERPKPPPTMREHGSIVRQRTSAAHEIETGEYFFARMFGYTWEEWLTLKANRERTIDRALLTWNDGIVRKIAKSISLDGSFDNLSILADALEESGCNDADILNHCRKPGQHLWRCWVVETIINPMPSQRDNSPARRLLFVEIVGGNEVVREHHRWLNRTVREEVDRQLDDRFASSPPVSSLIR